MDVAGAGGVAGQDRAAGALAVAQAVREGRQPLVDPDSYALREFRGDERVYQAGVRSFAKRLVNGAWARVELEVEAA